MKKTESTSEVEWLISLALTYGGIEGVTVLLLFLKAAQLDTEENMRTVADEVYSIAEKLAENPDKDIVEVATVQEYMTIMDYFVTIAKSLRAKGLVHDTLDSLDEDDYKGTEMSKTTITRTADPKDCIHKEEKKEESKEDAEDKEEEKEDDDTLDEFIQEMEKMMREMKSNMKSFAKEFGLGNVFS